MRSRFLRNSGRFILALMIFGAVLGIRLAPWPVDVPADEPAGFIVPVPQLRFRDPAALEAAVATQTRDDRDRAARHPAARRPHVRPPHHLGSGPPTIPR